MKAKVITTFRDKHDLKVIYEAGTVQEFTEERFAEILETGAFVERVEEEQPAKKKATKKKKTEDK